MFSVAAFHFEIMRWRPGERSNGPAAVGAGGRAGGPAAASASSLVRDSRRRAESIRLGHDWPLISIPQGLNY
jgi:hypothetical protein